MTAFRSSLADCSTCAGTGVVSARHFESSGTRRYPAICPVCRGTGGHIKADAHEFTRRAS